MFHFGRKGDRSSSEAFLDWVEFPLMEPPLPGTPPPPFAVQARLGLGDPGRVHPPRGMWLRPPGLAPGEASGLESRRRETPVPTAT